MASTTTRKKELIDFLWDWAGKNGEWSKLLVTKIVSTECALSDPDRLEVFNYFLQSIKLKEGLIALSNVKPVYTPTSKKIELESLSEVKGVNKLATDQEISFSNNLTVMYGENGSGKTGYGRILKALGFSYDSDSVIHHNIYESPVAKSALIKYKSDGTDLNYTWSGTGSNSDLESISVFNNNCVQISLGDGRGLIVSPIGFHLFNLITIELNKLAELLNKEIEKYPVEIIWLDTLNEGTPQHSFISKLSATSTESKLLELSGFTPEQEKELPEKELELKNLNKTLLEAQVKTLGAQISELDTLNEKIQFAKTNLNSDVWKNLIEFNKQIAELEKTTRKGIKELAETNNIEFYESKEFQAFIKSAESYIKLLSNKDYPQGEGETCIYCKQSFETEKSKELLANYRKLLNDTTQNDIKERKAEKLKITDPISNIDSSLIFHQSTFGFNSTTNEVLQPEKIKDYNLKIAEIKSLVATDKILEDSVFDFDYDSYSKILTDKKIELMGQLLNKKEILGNITTKEKSLVTKIAELKDRKLLSSRVEEVKKIIANKKIVSILESNTSSFSTNTLSRKTSEAREELIKQNFDQIFSEELKSLRKSQIKIELSFGTHKGQSKVQQKLNKYALSEILSEGEQKAIALAEFLTELQLDNSNSPVIFDDPVNSLDHLIIDDVARRLIKLSKDRQVVIFTHSVLLFNSIMYFSKQPTFKSQSYKFYNVKEEYGKTGVITEAEEEVNSVKTMIKKIEPLLNNTPKDIPESDIASDGYGYLRSAIELCVEHEIFQGTVKRYQKNITLTSFVKVDGGLLNQHKDKLNEIFERCCGFIKGHSNPVEIHNDPKLSDLKTDFDEFKSIRQQFCN